MEDQDRHIGQDTTLEEESTPSTPMNQQLESAPIGQSPALPRLPVITTTSSVTTKIEKFDGIDFQQWMYKLDLLLQEEELTEVVFEAPPPQGAQQHTINEWKKKDLKARSIISRALANSQITRIQTATTAREVIERLKEDYEPKGLASAFFLSKKLHTIRMEEGDSMTDHLNTIMELVQRLAGAGERLTDNQVMIHILISLPPSYETFSTVLQNSRDLSLRSLKSSLLQEEMRRKAESNTAYDKAFYSQTRQSNNPHQGKRPKHKGNQSTPFCQHCQRNGHSTSQCWSKNPSRKHGQSKSNRDSSQSGSNRPSNHHHAFMMAFNTSI